MSKLSLAKKTQLMDNNKRFDQLESLLVDLARKQDHQTEQIAQIITELNRQGEAINRQGEAISRQGEAISRQGEAINRQEKLLIIVSEQVDGIIEFLKLSATRHAETEQRQDAMLLEIQKQGQEMQRLGQRQDASVEALKLLLKRQEATDTRLDGVVQTQLQMLQLQRLDADKLDELGRRLPAAEDQEPRIKRLEDEVFRAAS